MYANASCIDGDITLELEPETHIIMLPFGKMRKIKHIWFAN